MEQETEVGGTIVFTVSSWIDLEKLVKRLKKLAECSEQFFSYTMTVVEGYPSDNVTVTLTIGETSVKTETPDCTFTISEAGPTTVSTGWAWEGRSQ